jgi:serine/threonine protein kinase
MGKYVVDGPLGPGGVTETYLVHAEPKPDAKAAASVDLLALKLLRPDRVPEGSFAEVAARFLSVARQLRDFHRPGFRQVVDISEDPASIFMVSQFISGCDLGRLLETCHAEGKQGVHPVLVGLIGSEVARLLHVGHSAKPVFCHLGLCPQNVILGPSGEVMLLDAGISAALRAITEQPAERWALVAPELQGVDIGAQLEARGERPSLARPGPAREGLETLPGFPSERSLIAADLYSLGALLFLLLTGQPPTLPATASGKAAVVEIPDIPGLTGKLAAALRTLLSYEPGDRPQDAAMLVEWLAGDIIQVRERQSLIAQGVHAAERGVRASSPDLPLVLSEQDRQPPAIKTPQPRQSTAKLAAPRRPARFLRVGMLLAVLVACTVAALASWWPGQARRRELQTSAQAAKHQQNVEMPRPTPKAGGESLAKPGADDPTVDREAADPVLAQVAGHLIIETVPPGAMVWVDGVLAGKTFADLVVGEGGHRIVVIAPGYRMFREVVDTSKGAIIRRTLPEIPPPVRGKGFIEVSCRTAGKFPVLLDDEETGLLCPAKMLPTSSGKHMVGIFVPHERRSVSVETTVEAGAKPTSVSFSQ